MNQPPLVVHTDWSRAWGGQEIRMLTELREMKKLGFRVAMVVREDSELSRRGKLEDIPVHYIDFSSKFNVRAWRDLYALFTSIKPEVVNTHSSEDSWMAGCVARICRVPLIIKTRHVLASISSPLSYNIFPHVVFACSESIGKQLVEQGVSAKKIIVQSSGIDEQRFMFNPQNREAVRQEYGITDQDILVGNVAFLRHYKGHGFITKTAAVLPEKYKFMIVGGGDDRALLEQQITHAGVEQRFILTGHRENPEKYFSAFDMIFFSSYATEGISQSFIQGLLYGLPLLTCKTPSVLEPLEFVRHYRTVDYGDVENASKAVIELSAHLERNEQQVAKQRTAVSAKYGLQKMVKTIVGVYEDYNIRVV